MSNKILTDAEARRMFAAIDEAEDLREARKKQKRRQPVFNLSGKVVGYFCPDGDALDAETEPADE